VVGFGVCCSVCIHPFIERNGRTGRLAMNLVLVRLGYLRWAPKVEPVDVCPKSDPGWCESGSSFELVVSTSGWVSRCTCLSGREI